MVLLVKCAPVSSRRSCNGSSHQMCFSSIQRPSLNSLISVSETFQIKQKHKRKKGLMAVANDYRAQAITQNCLKVLDLKVNYCGVQPTKFCLLHFDLNLNLQERNNLSFSTSHAQMRLSLFSFPKHRIVQKQKLKVSWGTHIEPIA